MPFRAASGRLATPIVLLVCASLACNLSPVRRFTATPRPTQAGAQVTLTFSVPPTETPLGQFGPTPTPGPPGGPSETPLGPGTPSVTPSGSETPTATGTPTPTATPTLTSTPTPGGSPTVGALTITNVVVLSVRRDSSRANGAIAVVEVTFSGGRGPYRFFDEGMAKPDNPFDVQTSCGASLVHTASVNSDDGQTTSKAYFANIACPAS